MSKIVAVADIHAYGHKLDKMFVELSLRVDLNETPLVFVGDYVDGGPDAKYVVQTLMDAQKQYPHWHFLMGNHEHMLLDAVLWNSTIYGSFYQWWDQGGKETARSYGYVPTNYPIPEVVRSKIGEDHLNWMKSLPSFYETDDFIFVHAGINDGELTKTTIFDSMWLRTPFIKSNYDWGKIVVAGHTYHEEPVVMKNKLIIDTMHHGGGYLTAVILDKSQKKWYDFVRV